MIPGFWLRAPNWAESEASWTLLALLGRVSVPQSSEHLLAAQRPWGECSPEGLLSGAGERLGQREPPPGAGPAGRDCRGSRRRKGLSPGGRAPEWWRVGPRAGEQGRGLGLAAGGGGGAWTGARTPPAPGLGRLPRCDPGAPSFRGRGASRAPVRGRPSDAEVVCGAQQIQVPRGGCQCSSSSGSR